MTAAVLAYGGLADFVLKVNLASGFATFVLLLRTSAPHTRIIAGSRDQPTPVAAAQFLHSRIAGADLKILDCAHFSNVEQPDAYAQLVLDFLRRPA